MTHPPDWLIQTLLDRAIDALERHDDSYHYLTPPGLIDCLRKASETLEEWGRVYNATAEELALSDGQPGRRSLRPDNVPQ